jgi:hypothetical protein
VAGAVLLAGCSGKDGYMAMGALAGATLGAVVGCTAGALLAATGSSDGGALCVAGLAAGGLAGAAGGAVIAENQEAFAEEEARLEALSRHAGEELAEAWVARAAAERLVAGHTAEIAALKAQAVRDEAALVRLKVALGQAEADRDRMVRVRDELIGSIAAIDVAVPPDADRTLWKRRQALRREVELLDAQIRALTLEIDDARGIV